MAAKAAAPGVRSARRHRRPANVGKSTLFNRLCGGHDAIVEDKPASRATRRYGAAEYSGVLFRVVDTGGLDMEAAKSAALWQGVLRQALRAVDEAAVVVFVTDVREGFAAAGLGGRGAAAQERQARALCRQQADSARLEDAAAELLRPGCGVLFSPISAAHGRGLPELLDAIVAQLPEGAPRTDDPEPEGEAEEALPHGGIGYIRVAFVGRPNAGKSSLSNALCDDERMIVDERPGPPAIRWTRWSRSTGALPDHRHRGHPPARARL